MSERIQRLYIGDEPEPSIRDLVSLSADQLRTLTLFFDEHGFFGGEMSDLQTLAARVGLTFERTADLVRLTTNLEAERVRQGLAPSDMIDEFETYLDARAPELKNRLAPLSAGLKSLFSDRPTIAFRSKVAAVASGVVPQAVDFYSLCDLRPVFNEERDEALEYIPVALIQILVRNSAQSENSSLIFQVTEDGVAKLEDLLKRLQKKMAFLGKVRDRLLEQKN